LLLNGLAMGSAEGALVICIAITGTGIGSFHVATGAGLHYTWNGSAWAPDTASFSPIDILVCPR